MHPGDEGRKVPARRRRRTPEIAEREIIAAAEAFLREQPFRALTVDEVMRRTDLSRPSFYVYFRDRHHLVLRVVEHLGSELYAMSERWLRGTGEGPQLAREALEGIVDVYAEHGPVMRALADAAADDPGVEQAYTGIVESFVRATARHIEEEIAVGADPAGRRPRDGEGARVDDGALPDPELRRRPADARRRRWPTRSRHLDPRALRTALSAGSAGGG